MEFTAILLWGLALFMEHGAVFDHFVIKKCEERLNSPNSTKRARMVALKLLNDPNRVQKARKAADIYAVGASFCTFLFVI